MSSGGSLQDVLQQGTSSPSFSRMTLFAASVHAAPEESPFSTACSQDPLLSCSQTNQKLANRDPSNILTPSELSNLLTQQNNLEVSSPSKKNGP